MSDVSWVEGVGKDIWRSLNIGLDLFGLFPRRALKLMVAFARGSRRGEFERLVYCKVILGDQEDRVRTCLVFIPMLPCFWS